MRHICSCQLVLLYIVCIITQGTGLTIYPDTVVARGDDGKTFHICNTTQDTAYIDSLFIKADSACFLSTDNYTYDDSLCVTYVMRQPYKVEWRCIAPPPNFYSEYFPFDEMCCGESILQIPPGDTALYSLYFSWTQGGPLTKKVAMSKHTAAAESYHIASIIFKSRTQGADTIDFRGWVQEGVSIKEKSLLQRQPQLDARHMHPSYFTPHGKRINSRRLYRQGIIISSEGRVIPVLDGEQ